MLARTQKRAGARGSPVCLCTAALAKARARGAHGAGAGMARRLLASKYERSARKRAPALACMSVSSPAYASTSDALRSKRISAAWRVGDGGEGQV